MVRFLAVVAGGVFIAACGLTSRSGTDEAEYAEATTFLREEIVQRMDCLQYQSGDELVRNLTRLTYIGEPAIPFLLEGLDAESARTRGASAFVLGNLRDRRTLPALRAKLTDPVGSVRYEAATALCAIGENKGYPILIGGLSDPDIRNRFKAHEALKLLTSLDFGYHHDDDPAVRQTAVLRWEEWWNRLEERPL